MTEKLSEDDNREVDTDEVDLDDREVDIDEVDLDDREVGVEDVDLDDREVDTDEDDLDDRENSTLWEQGGNKVRRRTFLDIFENDQLSEEGEEGHRDIIQKNSI